MKKLALITLALTCAAGAFAQGTVSFANRISGTLITHIYAPLAGAPGQHQIGNGTLDTPTTNTVGVTTSWAGYTLIGAGGIAGPYGASTTFSQLLSANGSGQAESALQGAIPVTTFRTGGAAGNIVSATATLGNVPQDSAVATFEMVAWDNSSGLYSTWSQASVAWLGGLIAAGESGRFDVTQVGGTQNGNPNLTGLQSFNLYFAVPEPTSFALVGLGAAALMIFRRRK